MIKHLHEAIFQFKEADALLTIGERNILDKWLDLSQAAQRLHLFLFHRKPTFFRRENIQYVDENKPHYFSTLEAENQAIQELLSSGFLLYCRDFLSNTQYLDCIRKDEVVELCKVKNLAFDGSKVECIDRLIHVEFPRSVHLYHLEHRELFRQICRQYTFAHEGDLQTLLLASLDEVPISYIPYKTTSPLLLHRTRKEVQDYQQWKSPEPISVQKPLLQQLNPGQYRFSGIRFWVGHLLKNIPSPMNLDWIELLKEALPFAKSEALVIEQRLALSYLELGAGDVGLRRLKGAFNASKHTLDLILLSQTGRHLARRIKGTFPPLPILHTAVERRLQWNTKKIGTRQTYNEVPVEYAVIQHLTDQGRTVVRTENAPWNCAFALIFLDIIFLDIENNLPSPIMSAPIDFNTEYFYLSRQEAIDNRLQELLFMGARALIESNVYSLPDPIEQYHIRGCNWKEFDCDELLDFLDFVPTMILHRILKNKLLHPSQSHRGLPDLCVLPGESKRIPDLFPSKIVESFFFLEVKSERDTLSPYQQHWIHVLKDANAVVEIWNIYSKGTRHA